ncbi:GspE/PulE/PilB domain-containing protein [Geomonas anaerohicana]|uniref:General secretion pathway protein n=1 Tax=Geomonas anaerohicana TaxID=2798583 RepID=A0ABS0Y9L9_9BACT|nr:general secretion pathway protein [Geomonas anaerohicana]MBJ6748814.1 general secretion pathway protein [Geomonas anaerohicana]
MRLGEMLVQAGKITAAQLDETLKGQAIFGGRFGTNLVEMGYLDELDLAEFLSQKIGVAYAAPAELLDIPQHIIKLIPFDYVKKYKVVPIALNNRKVTLAMVDPTDLHAIDEIAFATGYIIVPVVAAELRIVTAMEKYYGIKREVRYISVEGGSRGRAKHHATHSAAPQPAAPAARVVTAAPVPEMPKATLEEWPTDLEDEVLDLPMLEELSMEVLDQGGTAPAAAAAATPAAQPPLSPPASPAPAVAAAAPAAPPAPAPEATPAPEPPAGQPSTAPAATVPEPTVLAELYQEELEEPEQDYSLESVLVGLAEADDRDWIAELITGHLGPQFRRVAFFLLRGGSATGWMARVDNKPVPEFEGLELSLNEPSVLSVVNQSKSFFLGPMPPTPGNQAIMEALKGGTPFNNLLVPLLMMGRVVAVLYVGGGSAPLDEKLPEVQKLIAKAAMAFEILILKSKIMMT